MSNNQGEEATGAFLLKIDLLNGNS